LRRPRRLRIRTCCSSTPRSVLEIDVRDGRLQPRHGGASDPTAVVTADATTLVDLAFSRLELDDALARGRITVAGDQAKGHRLLESMTRARTGAAST
jgi:Alkyl sulfatase C-terminal